MKRQNVTLSIPVSLLKKAKLVAAKMNTSLTEIMRRSLEEAVRDATGYRRAMTRQLALLDRGVNMGTKGRIRVSREALHER